jgi:hypothetical protein
VDRGIRAGAHDDVEHRRGQLLEEPLLVAVAAVRVDRVDRRDGVGAKRAVRVEERGVDRRAIAPRQDGAELGVGVVIAPVPPEAGGAGVQGRSFVKVQTTARRRAA